MSKQINTAVGHTADEAISSQDTRIETERVVTDVPIRSGSTWSVEEIVSRIWPLRQGELNRVDMPSIALAGNQSILSIPWPTKMQNVDQYDVWSLFSRFPLVSFDTTFILSVNSTITNGGFLSMHWDPQLQHGHNMLDRDYRTGDISYFNMRYVSMDLSKDSDLELHIPFENITNFLAGRQNQTFCSSFLGMIHLVRTGSIFIPASVPSSITYSLSVRFSNVKTFGYGAVPTNRLDRQAFNMPDTMFNSSQQSQYLFGDQEAGNGSFEDSTLLFRKHYYRSFGWSSGMSRGTLLGDNQNFVHPLYPRNVNTPRTSFSLSNLSYLSLIYGAWQGDLRFTFQVAASQMMTGRLCVVHNPYLAPISNIVTQYQNFPHTIIDIKESHVFSVEIPFLMMCTRAPLHHFYVGRSVQKSSNGRLEVFVMQPLRSSTDATFAVSVNVFVEPLNNFGFSISSVPSIETSVKPSTFNRQALIGHQLPPPRFSHQLSIHSLMQDFFKVVDFNVRSVPFANIIPNTNFKLGNDTTFCFPVTPILATHPDIAGNSLHPVCHISRMFAFWSGTLRFKIVVDTRINHSESSLRICHHVDMKNPKVGVSTILNNTNVQEIPIPCDVNNLYEFDVPCRIFYDRLHVTHNEVITPAEGRYNGWISITWPSAFQGNATIYMSVGNDFRLFGYCGAIDCVRFNFEGQTTPALPSVNPPNQTVDTPGGSSDNNPSPPISGQGSAP